MTPHLVSRIPRPRALLAVVLAPFLCASVVAAYLQIGIATPNGVVAAKWTQMPVRYFITNRAVTGVTAAQLQTAVQAAFDTWGRVPTVTLSSSFAGFTSAEPASGDQLITIGFQSRPELDRILGTTSFDADSVTGRLNEADIFLNSAFPWSVAAAGESGRYDVQTIATHEIGHLYGLSHSAIGETEVRPEGGRRILGKLAVMFPIAYPAGNIIDRALEPDDIAGMSGIYPTTALFQKFGGISGRVTLNGQGVMGAHVTAFNPSTGALVGGFSANSQGQFGIGGLTPGTYIVRVEPLDDADVTSFFEDTTKVNVDFRAGFYAKLVAVPAGGSGPAIEIKVTAK